MRFAEDAHRIAPLTFTIFDIRQFTIVSTHTATHVVAYRSSCSFINISFSRFLRLARLETYAQFEKVDIFISCIARVTRIKFSLRSLKLDIRFFVSFVSFFTTNVFIFFTILIRQANLLLRERIIFDFFFCIKSFTILAILAPFATISCQTL